jgi:hypothetical protein
MERNKLRLMICGLYRIRPNLRIIDATGRRWTAPKVMINIQNYGILLQPQFHYVSGSEKKLRKVTYPLLLRRLYLGLGMSEMGVRPE